MQFFRRLWFLWSRERLDRDLQEQMRQHLELKIQENLAAGMAEDEARRRAHSEFGNPAVAQESTHATRGFPSLESLFQDIRFGLRLLWRSPGFTAVAIITLALGIGANTAIFSVINAVLLRPLPFPQPERLVMVFNTLAGVTNQNGISYPNFRDLQASNPAFEQMGAYQQDSVTITGVGEARAVPAAVVTSSVFGVLKTEPMAGRIWTPEEDLPASAPVVVLGENLWRQQFGGDTSLIGRTIFLDRRPFTVVGIMPASFRFPYTQPRVQAWIPLVHSSAFSEMLKWRDGHYLHIIGRLKPGVSLAQAQTAMATAQASQVRDYPKENSEWGIRLQSFEERLIGDQKRPLLILMSAVTVVLLIACANLANLLLARGAGRSREVALRQALGASSGRLHRQFITESTLLSLIAGSVGLAAAWWGMAMLKHVLPSDIPRIEEIKIDGWVLAFSLLIALAAGIFFGLLPAWQASGANPGDSLKEHDARGSASGGRRRLRAALVVAEVMLSVVLLAGAGLLVRSLQRLQSVDPGFQPNEIVTLSVTLPRQRYPQPQQWAAFFNQLEQQFASLPGVQGVGAALPLPLSGSSLNLAYAVEGRPPLSNAQTPTAEFAIINPDYFDVMRIPLLRGRAFTAGDGADAPKVCIISETIARRSFPNDDPIGKNLIFGFSGSTARRIVGVVRDVKFRELQEDQKPEMYVPFSQAPLASMQFAVRAPRNIVNSLVPTLAAKVHALDRDLPVDDITPMAEVVSQTIAPQRFRTLLLGLFGAVAMLLTAVGVYGVLSYNVSTRTREIGIRMALGSTRGDVQRMVLRQGMLQIVVGLAAGLALAFALTRLLQGMLYGVSTADPLTFVSVVALVTVVALIACYVPARRATKVDPMIALRQE
jgi:putative ABC transport system permease protein